MPEDRGTNGVVSAFLLMDWILPGNSSIWLLTCTAFSILITSLPFWHVFLMRAINSSYPHQWRSLANLFMHWIRCQFSRAKWNRSYHSWCLNLLTLHSLGNKVIYSASAEQGKQRGEPRPGNGQGRTKAWCCVLGRKRALNKSRSSLAWGKGFLIPLWRQQVKCAQGQRQSLQDTFGF